MDSHDFVDSDFGKPKRVGSGPGLYCAYFPKPIPRSLPLDEDTSAELSTADRALGRLGGSGRQLKNPLLIADLYIRREALASTRIEGTQATLDDLYEAETTGDVGADVREVLNYVRALYLGLDAIKTSPITLELVSKLHVQILTGVRGDEKQPGIVRGQANWIGSNDPATARFVPPPFTELNDGLADWVNFANQELRMPPLIQCALMHYQFETLHPYLDGNGRLGRLLIILYLIRNDHLPQPLLYLSTYLEAHKQEYYDSLQGVRERGDIQAWLQYFLKAVAAQANDAVRRSERLVDLGDVYRSRLAGYKGRAHELIDELLASPSITTQRVRQRLNLSNPGATNMLRHLESIGILRQVGGGPGRANRWIAHEVMAAVRD